MCGKYIYDTRKSITSLAFLVLTLLEMAWIVAPILDLLKIWVCGIFREVNSSLAPCY